MAPGQNPPLPPDVQQQIQSPEQAQSVFMANGLNQPQSGMEVVQQIMAKMQELDKWAGETKQLIDGFDPSLAPLLRPIGEAGMKIMETVQSKAKSSGMARGSSVVPQQPPANPSAGPPNPAMQ